MDRHDSARSTARRAPPILGIGVDIIEVDRMKLALRRGGDRFLRRVFTPGEAEACATRRHPARHLAARFAAKEAAVKALSVPQGRGWLWLSIEVVGIGGPPEIRLTGRAALRARELGVSASFLSLSHSDTHAVAMVVLS